MKKNFKYVTMMAVALSMGFTGCSNDSDEQQPDVVNANSHSVTIKVATKAAQTRADEATAIGQTPNLSDLTLYFVDDVLNKITDIQVATPATITGAGETFNNLAAGTNAIYIVGNQSEVASADLTALSVGDTETDLKEAMLNILGQSAATAPTYENVNVYGYTSYAVGVGQTQVSVTMDIIPAISRLEIGKVEADKVNPPVADQITDFDLEGIFINNTYQAIGLDNVTYGTAVAYPSTDAIWGAPVTYPAQYCDQFTTLTGLDSYTPTNTWAYYVAPAAKQVGGSYVGEIISGVQYDAKPIIVLKLSNVTYNAGYGGTQYDPAYVTVTKLKNGATYLDHFERGKVYDISSIAFDATNLTGTPLVPPVHDVEVTVTVKPWDGISTTPEL